MNVFLLYLIKASISLAIFYGFYAFVNKREVFFNFNRAFLLTAILCASLLPLLNFNLFNYANNYAQSPQDILYYAQLPSIQLNEVVINSEPNHSSSFLLISILTIIYFAVVIFKLGQFLFRLQQISTLTNRYKNIIKDGIRYVLTTDDLPVFSFFNRIFINENTFSKSDAVKIIEHEKIHIKQYHSVDLLFAELVAIFQWFNPFAYLLKKAIKENHEFIADQQIVTKHTDSNIYKLLLLEYASVIKTNKLTHNFSHSLLKRRLDMINKPRKPLRIGIGLFGAVLAFSFVLFACSTPAGDEQIANIEMPEIELIDDVYEVVDVMPEYPGGMDSLIAFFMKNIKYPESAKENGIEGKVIVNFIVEKDGSIGEAEVIQSVSDDCDAEALRVINAMPDWSPGQKGGENVRVSFKLPIGYNLGNGSEKKEVFKVVEQMPEFPGGTSALMKYLGSNIKYPEQAKRDSIQGKVFVQFVVGVDGSIENVHVLRGIGSGCDEEAIRVISNMPKWKPGMDNGKAVQVEYNIPVKYALK